MKAWAMDRGATHYTHWFQPLTDGTAEKHDGFIDFGDNGNIIEAFSGKLLAQQEPDASSFPSGGIRQTFEARGYTAWDVSSPAFVVGTTLCVPTVFISYTGEALDYKTPLLKALAAVDKAAVGVCQYFDKNVTKVHTNLGWEQEYFLIDTALYQARPDLVLTGRTLMGHSSSKDQQLDDHYFGSIPERVSQFMIELEIEAHMLGIPVKTRHNEVAPNQFEIAPIFEEANLANDHNQLIMDVMKRVARHHKFEILFHEKPFAGINGSGKHNNWSLGTNTGVNLLAPGKNPKGNLQFLTFLTNVMAAVYKNQDLLRASILTTANSHRLGANEAPPAIISIFLGSQISSMLQNLAEKITDQKMTPDEKTALKLGIGRIPEILLDNTDRNRTSPFAFTGNRFEFRAVGSEQSIAGPLIAMNAMLADSLNWIADKLEAELKSGKDEIKAVIAVLKELMELHGVAVFGGDGYSSDWHKEAVTERGLKNLPTTADALPYLKDKEIVELFKSTGVLSERELASRYEIYAEQYVLKIEVEARLVIKMATTMIYPAASRYLADLALTNASMADTGIDIDNTIAQTVATEINAMMAAVSKLSAASAKEDFANTEEHLQHMANEIRGAMDEVRIHADALEGVVADDMWPLATYEEMLFIK